MNNEKKIRDILITLTDITGFDHSTSALEAFTKAEGELNQLIEQAEKAMIKKLRNDIACEDCNGTGVRATPSDYGPCGTCNGFGFNSNSTFKVIIESLESNLK